MHTIFIGIGSNIEREAHCQAAFEELDNVFEHLKISNVYESEAIGFNGAVFFNAVAQAETNMSLKDVVATLKGIETKYGWHPGLDKYESKKLDLDLLLYDDVIQTSGTILPREEILTNAFVLLPLSEIAPNVIHPVKNQQFSELWNKFDKASQKLWRSSFSWQKES